MTPHDEEVMVLMIARLRSALREALKNWSKLNETYQSNGDRGTARMRIAALNKHLDD